MASISGAGIHVMRWETACKATDLKGGERAGSSESSKVKTKKDGPDIAKGTCLEGVYFLVPCLLPELEIPRN